MLGRSYAVNMEYERVATFFFVYNHKTSLPCENLVGRPFFDSAPHLSNSGRRHWFLLGRLLVGLSSRFNKS